MAEHAVQTAGHHGKRDVSTEIASIGSSLSWLGEVLDERGNESGAGEILHSLSKRLFSLLDTMGVQHG